MPVDSADEYIVDDNATGNSSIHSTRPSRSKDPLLFDMSKTLDTQDAVTPSRTTVESEGIAGSDVPDTTVETRGEGSKLTIQTLYEGPPQCNCCINWVKEHPADLRMEIEQEEQTKQKALIVRMRKNHKEGKSLVLDSVLVQSKSLKETLARVFEGYQGITPNLKKLVFRAPFHPFYYRWEKFTQVLNDQKANDPEASSYTQLLYDVLDAELRDVRGEIADLLGNGVIKYELLWSIFEPGERVITKVGPNLQFVVAKSSGFNGDGIFEGVGKYIDWDGDKFGYASGKMKIRPFEGTQQVTELDAYPARFHRSLEATESEAIARGKRFRDLRGFHHMTYSGIAAYNDAWGGNVGYKADGRIIIDAEAFYNAYPDERHDTNSDMSYISGVDERPELEALDSAALVPQIYVQDRRHGGDRWHVWKGLPVEMDESHKDEELQPAKRKESTVHDLTNEQLLLCTSKLRGYSLKLKSWATFDIAGVKEITWNDAAFHNLMLPGKYKSLVLSFVEGQIFQKHAFDDIIEGKGQGVMMLLVGNPGTGKTLTAEAVAERVRRPLYTLSVGELGHGGEGVEKRLKFVLEHTEKWNAVLLFDECDVLLQKRSSSNLQHNGIVAVFLRMLEYYRGIIIMTSNRAETMDRAFQSRIHLTLRYPDLDTAAKEHIWRYFVTQRKAEAALTAEDYHRLAQLPMNGRQIKNTVKISMLLAAQEGEELSIDYIDTVLEATVEMGTADS